MGTMTLEQVRDKLRQYAMDSVTYYNKTGDCLEFFLADDLADTIDAHLRERESAKVGVTDETVETACKAAAMEADTAVFPDAYSDEEADDLRKAMRAALESFAARRAAVPDGWKLVPIELTDDMERAAEKTCKGQCDQGGCFHVIYRDMLAAAPKTEKE